LIGAVRNAVREVDARLPITTLRTVDEQIDEALVTERLVAGLSASFGAVALILTCLGLYGVLAYLTVRRRHEIGVRVALGASRANVIGLVLGGTIWLLGLGLAIGAPAAWLSLQAASSLLFKVGATDISVLAATGGFLIAVGLLASYLPAFRATRVNPISALRSD
jgi:ABC-type antimicrobial peptide transport system permease subunit